MAGEYPSLSEKLQEAVGNRLAKFTELLATLRESAEKRPIFRVLPAPYGTSYSLEMLPEWVTSERQAREGGHNGMKQGILFGLLLGIST
jgi:hypothetical protein